jgi:hypothetical protein
MPRPLRPSPAWLLTLILAPAACLGTAVEDFGGQGGQGGNEAPPPSDDAEPAGAQFVEAPMAESPRCGTDTFGPNCTPCSCVHGTCYDGPEGNGTCWSCETGFYGFDCYEPCHCAGGTCEDGVAGSGVCITCGSGMYGPACDQACNCPTGSCNDGVDGDGSCM